MGKIRFEAKNVRVTGIHKEMVDFGNGPTAHLTLEVSDEAEKYPITVAVNFWGDDAKALGHITEGTLVDVQGRIKSKGYTDKNGKQRFGTNVNGTDLTVVGAQESDAGFGDVAPAPEPPQEIEIPF